MTDEDKTAAKLKGYACLLKFKDGEELLLKVPDVLDGNEEESSVWFEEAENFINNTEPELYKYFPLHGIAVSRESIKYIVIL